MFVRWVRSELKRQNISIYELARRSDLNPAVLWRGIMGEKDIRASTLEKVIKGLGYSKKMFWAKKAS